MCVFFVGSFVCAKLVVHMKKMYVDGLLHLSCRGLKTKGCFLSVLCFKEHLFHGL